MRRFKAGLFLMELTISLFFFSIAAAVCLQLFAKAHTINEEAEALGGAHTIATNIAENYLAGNWDPSITHLDYQENLTPINHASNYSVDLQYDNGTLNISITAPSITSESYSLQVYKYIPTEVWP